MNHQKVHQIVTSSGYDGQDIYLGEDHTADDSEETLNLLRSQTQYTVLLIMLRGFTQ